MQRAHSILYIMLSTAMIHISHQIWSTGNHDTPICDLTCDSPITDLSYQYVMYQPQQDMDSQPASHQQHEASHNVYYPGDTILHWALRNHSYNTLASLAPDPGVTQLLQHRNAYHESGFDLLLQPGNEPVLRYLLRKSNPRFLRDEWGNPMYTLAIKHRNEDAMKAICNVDIDRESGNRYLDTINNNAIPELITALLRGTPGMRRTLQFWASARSDQDFVTNRMQYLFLCDNGMEQDLDQRTPDITEPITNEEIYNYLYTGMNPFVTCISLFYQNPTERNANFQAILMNKNAIQGITTFINTYKTHDTPVLEYIMSLFPNHPHIQAILLAPQCAATYNEFANRYISDNTRGLAIQLAQVNSSKLREQLQTISLSYQPDNSSLPLCHMVKEAVTQLAHNKNTKTIKELLQLLPDKKASLESKQINSDILSGAIATGASLLQHGTCDETWIMLLGECLTRIPWQQKAQYIIAITQQQLHTPVHNLINQYCQNQHYQARILTLLDNWFIMPAYNASSLYNTSIPPEVRKANTQLWYHPDTGKELSLHLLQHTNHALHNTITQSIIPYIPRQESHTQRCSNPTPIIHDDTNTYPQP